MSEKITQWLTLVLIGALGFMTIALHKETREACRCRCRCEQAEAPAKPGE